MTAEGEVLTVPVSSSPDAVTVDDENPWPGLAAFREVDSAYFHGRNLAIESLHRLVQRGLLSVLFGVSGLGKTSLLAAGLFPRWRQEGFLPVYIRLDFSPGSPGLVAQVQAALAREAAAAKIEAPASREGETLWELFHRQGAELWSPRDRVVIPILVFDQFEEIFTLGRSRPELAPARQAFRTELADLIEGRPPAAVKARLDAAPEEARAFSFSRHPYKVILSLREDFLPNLEDLRPLIPSLAHNRMRLQPMDGEEARQVVLGAGSTLVAPDVAEQIVRLVAGEDDASAPSAAKPLADLAVEPALLSLFCRELNNRRIEKELSQIDPGLLESARGQIYADFYERGLKGFDPRLRAFIEDQLLTDLGFRQSEPLEDALRVPGVTLAAIDRLVDYRLLRVEEHFGQPHVELIHDVLAPVVRTSRDLRREREAHQRERAARRRQLRWALAVGAGLFVALLGWAILSSSIAYKKAAQFKREAQERQDTDALINTLLASLQRTLTAKGQGKDLSTAVSQLGERLAKAPSSSNSALSYSKLLGRLGEIQLEQEDGEAAYKTFESRLDFAKGISQKDPENTVWIRELAESSEGLGDAFMLLGQTQGAFDSYQDGFMNFERLARQPGGEGWGVKLAVLHAKLGDALLKEGKPGEALDRYQQSSTITSQFAATSSASYLQQRLATTRSRMGDAELALGKAQDAAVSYRDSQDRLQELLQGNPKDPNHFAWRHGLAHASLGLGWSLVCQQQSADPDAAFKAFQDSFVRRMVLARADPTNVALQEELAASFYALAEAALGPDGGGPPGTKPCGPIADRLPGTLFQKDFPTYFPGRQPLSDDDPVQRVISSQQGIVLSNSYISLGDALLAADDARGALAAYSLALSLREGLWKQNANDSTLANLAAWSHVLMGTAFEGLGRRDRAEQEWQRVLEILAPFPRETMPKVALDTVAQALLDLDKLEDARPVVEQLCQGPGWKNRKFRDLARKKGLVLEDVPGGGCRLAPPGP
jgi:tetratricopeptide (TPR) repeat protein